MWFATQPVMVGSGKVSWRMIGGEVAGLATAILALPLRWLVDGEHLDRAAPDGPPVVFVHGLLGHPTNFIVLRHALGERSFASFAYAPRLDYRYLAVELGRRIEAVCDATGASRVDVVGHSLGGLAAHYLVASGGGHRVRRLVTLRAPPYPSRLLGHELAILGPHHPLGPGPDPRPPPPGGLSPSDTWAVVCWPEDAVVAATHPPQLSAGGGAGRTRVGHPRPPLPPRRPPRGRGLSRTAGGEFRRDPHRARGRLVDR